MPGLMVSGRQPPALTAAINKKEPSRLQPSHRERLIRVLAVLRGHNGWRGQLREGAVG